LFKQNRVAGTARMDQGGGVDDRSRVLLSAVLGALVGGVAGYLYLTEDGRGLRIRLEPGLDDVAKEMRRLRQAVDKARVAAEEGWRTLEEVTRPLATHEPGGFARTGRPPVAM
jgi:hypothetical protein